MVILNNASVYKEVVMWAWFNSRRYLYKHSIGKGSSKPDKECNICVYDCMHSLTLEELEHTKLKPRDPHTTFTASMSVHDINMYDIVDDIYKLYDLRKLPGVYCFFNKDYLPMYVGQTTNIWERMKKHIRGKDPTTGNKEELYKYFRHVRIYQLDTWDSPHRWLLEQMIIAKEKPVFNLYSIGYVKKKFYKQVLRDHIDSIGTIGIKQSKKN